MSELINETNPGVHPFREEPSHKRGHNHIWAGLFVIVIGVVLLLRQTGVLFPHWLFTWPVILVAAGLFSGIRRGFRHGPWFVLILAGSIFLADKVNPELGLKNYIWPFVIITIGVVLMLRPKKHRHWKHGMQQNDRKQRQGANENEDDDDDDDDDGGFSFEVSISDEGKTEKVNKDFIDVTSVFGGVKKIVLSKNFKGGDVVNFMAGTEINLTQADIHGRITIDATNIFGGTKLIIPPTWDVQSNIVTIFGGVDDKRQVQGITLDPTKVVHLEGTCLFGGIEIKSY